MLGPIDSDNEQSAPKRSQKIIHEPSNSECEQICLTMVKMGINGSDRVILAFGRKVFNESWVSDVTKNWLRTLDHDVKLYEDIIDPVESKLFVVMVELDYMMVMYNLRLDAQRELQRQKAVIW